MAIQNGNLIRLYLNGTIISKLVANDLNLSSEMLDATDKYSANWKVSQPGNKSFTMSCEGFLVDPYDKNILLYSENFANAYWTKSGATISATLYADPNGFIRANRTVNFSTGDSIGTTVSGALTPGDYVFSVWIKAVTGTVNIDLELKDVNDGNTESIKVNTTWTRYEVTHNLSDGNGTEVTIIAGTDGEIQVFGAQLELGTTATAYEPTGLRFHELFDAVDNGTEFTAIVTDSTTGNKEYEGAVYLSNVALTAPQGQLVTFTCDIEGSGALTTNTI